MKKIKILLLLVVSSFMTACSVNTSAVREDCINEFPANERVGILQAYKIVEETIITYFLSARVDIKREDKTGCMMSCSPGFTASTLGVNKFKTDNPTLVSLLEDSKDRQVCVPSRRPCLPSGFESLLGLDLNNVFSSSSESPLIGTLSGIDAAVYSGCSSGEGPTECLEGNVLNTETNSCVPQEMSCTEEELNGIGAATGYKQFNTMTNSYDLCQALTCQSGYTLGLGICNPDEGGGGGPEPVYGCMDSRAANYNPLADTDDMSCVCGPLSMPYNPITGCEDMP